MGRMPANFAPTSLDHVALWVDEREPLARFLCDHLGMHVIEETDTFTLVGIDAKLGKLVNDLDAVLESLPFSVGRRGDGVTAFEAPAGLPLGLVEAEGEDFDLDHVVLGLQDPEAALAGFEQLGFDRRSDNGSVAVADRCVRVVRGSAADGGRPLLNHLALLVDDAHGVQDEAEGAGLEVDDVKDAKNTFAVFLRGPEGVRVEYVEHKPGFALV